MSCTTAKEHPEIGNPVGKGRVQTKAFKNLSWKEPSVCFFVLVSFVAPICCKTNAL